MSLPSAHTHFARELWRRVESIHAVTYFAEESTETTAELGVRGFWRTYFGYRAAPLGVCSAATVTAAFFGFSPTMVSRAVPSIWELASPTELIEARHTAAAAALRRIAGEEIDALTRDGWALGVLRNAVEAAIGGSRPLFLANRNLPTADDPVAALWQVATTVREHRGDGHVAAWTAQGFAPVDVALLFVATGGTSREALQPNRGWTDDEWDDAAERLGSRQLLAAGKPTSAGRDVVARVESVTDTLAASPFETLDDGERQRLLDALTPAARAMAASAAIPAVNPMGLPLVDG
ncbi:MAG: hypothetical protein AAGA42_08105 [Actinomycetota bacterium]